ncbi:MAG: TatD family hydrolase [Actinomycetota bacterium]
MFIDTHVHLDFADFQRDRSETVARAEAAGVSKMINVGSSLQGSRDSIKLSKEFPGVYATVGIHPHDAGEATQRNLAELLLLASKPKVVAIGEIGLDYFKSKTSPQLQKEAFLRQLDMAIRLNKPVIIHSRDAEEDMLDVFWQFQGVRGVLHFFSGSPDFAKAAVSYGLYVSFTGVITYKPRQPGRGSGAEYDALREEIINSIPADRLMIETDCPFAAPEPYRGKRCEPAYVVEVARRLAEVRGISLDEIERVTTENAERFFGLSDQP